MEVVSSDVTPNGGIANVKACEKAQRFMDILTEEARSSQDIYPQLTWEPFSAITDLMCGRIEQSNEKFKRCLNLARSHQQLLALPKICLLYAYSLAFQKKVG